MKKTFDALRELSEFVATRRDVVDKQIGKSAIGIDFVTENLTGQTATIDTLSGTSATINSVAIGSSQGITAPGVVRSNSEILVGGSLASNPNIIRTVPTDGDQCRIVQTSTDDSIRIINDTTGVTSAFFYRDGRAYVDLLNSSIGNNHLANSSVDQDKVANGSINRDKVANDEIVLSHMNDDTKNRSQGTHSMRSLSDNLGGSSVSASPGNHSHFSVNFNSEYTIEQKERSANLKTTVEGMRQSAVHTQIYPLIDLVLDLAHQLLDDPGIAVQEKVRKLKEDPVYVHEFRMQYDDEYYAAWAIDNDPTYAAKVQDDPRIQEMAAHARQVYTRIEDDPVIVEDYKRRRGPFS